MSAIYDNAVDSLKVGIKFFLSDKNYTSRKHSILTIFHSIELILKEYLYRIDPILIYRNIDKKINDDSQTVGINEILIRLDNLKLSIPNDQRKTITRIQKRRNRIEHHRYDEKEEDEKIIGESLKFILFFVEHFLEEKLERDIESEILIEIQRLVHEYNELYSLAMYRLEKWMKSQWRDWDPYETNTPEQFEGTLDCPECRESYLVIGYFEEPFCFWCNTTIKAKECEDCGVVYNPGDGHECY